MSRSIHLYDIKYPFSLCTGKSFFVDSCSDCKSVSRLDLLLCASDIYRRQLSSGNSFAGWSGIVWSYLQLLSQEQKVTINKDIPHAGICRGELTARVRKERPDAHSSDVQRTEFCLLPQRTRRYKGVQVSAGISITYLSAALGRGGPLLTDYTELKEGKRTLTNVGRGFEQSQGSTGIESARGGRRAERLQTFQPYPFRSWRRARPVRR